MPRSVLDAIRQGDWSFEPNGQQPITVKATAAMPGTSEKLDVLPTAERGCGLWHEEDRLSYDDRSRLRRQAAGCDFCNAADDVKKVQTARGKVLSGNTRSEREPNGDEPLPPLDSRADVPMHSRVLRMDICSGGVASVCRRPDRGVDGRLWPGRTTPIRSPSRRSKSQRC